MADEGNPLVVSVEDLCDGTLDPDEVRQVRKRAAEMAEAIPARYADRAVATNPALKAWVAELVRDACANYRITPTVVRGSSLRLLGPTGTGKTFEAYGAIRALSVSGVRCAWNVVTAADVYAKLRPRQGVDSEIEFERYAKVTLLVLDDLGAAKSTEWIEEVNYRLINARWERQLPTLFTSNLAPQALGERMGERVMSRILGMSTQVLLKGPDRRLQS